jgi:hypothetical protein
MAYLTCHSGAGPLISGLPEINTMEIGSVAGFRVYRFRPTRAGELPMDKLLTVHDPRGYPPKVAGKGLAARQPSLDGRLLYLVDCLFDNSAAFMEQLRQRFLRACRGRLPSFRVA